MDIQLPQILFQIINFGVVMGALTFLLYKPIQKIMDERAEKIVEGQAAAQAAAEEKAKLSTLRAKIEKEAERKAAIYLEKAAEKATEQKREILAKARTEAEAEVAKLKEQWKTEKQQLTRSMQQEMIKAVMAVAERVVGLKLDAKTDADLISTELTKVLEK
jgi:F-type H+-transporting ATPase subunit b